MMRFEFNAKCAKGSRKGTQSRGDSLRTFADTFATFAFDRSYNRRSLKSEMGSWLGLLLLLLLSQTASNAQPARSSPSSTIEASSLNTEINTFLEQEMTAHLNDIKSYDPAPDKVFNAGTTGEYTWGSFANAVGAYAAMSGKRTLGNHDLAREVGQI